MVRESTDLDCPQDGQSKWAVALKCLIKLGCLDSGIKANSLHIVTIINYYRDLQNLSLPYMEGTNSTALIMTHPHISLPTLTAGA